MVMEILGIIIAFVSVILLFSLLVTSIGHLLQGAFQLRFTQLKNGLKSLADELGDSNSEEYQSITRLLEANSLEGRVIKESCYVGIDTIKNQISHIENKIKLRELENKIDRLFPLIEQSMNYVFKKWMDKISVLIAFVLCIVFQLNTFDLLRDISSNPELKKQYIQIGEGIVNQNEAYKNIINHDAISISVIEQLTSDASEGEKVYLEELSGTAVTGISSALHELKIVLEEKPDLYDKLSAKYREIYEKELLVSLQKSKDILDKNKAILAEYNFRVLPNGASYYLPNHFLDFLNVWLGLLLSTILISLGAPFWFDTLKKLFKVRNEISLGPK